MKNQCKIAAAFTLLFSATTLTIWAQSTAFTYQGRLSDSGNAANGVYDFRFRLASDSQANNYVGSPVLSSGVAVSDGLFTVSLDFGQVFTGSNYWLEVDVRTNGASSYTALSPLQSLTSVPYALYAMTPAGPAGPPGSQGPPGAAGPPGPAGTSPFSLAGTNVYYINGLVGIGTTNPTAELQVTGTVSAASFVGSGSGLTGLNGGAIAAGSITGSQLAAGSVGTTQLADGGVSGVKLAAGSVTPASLGLSAFETTFWQGSGNSGTSPGNGNFLGTTDNQPLELRVNQSRALRLEPDTNNFGAPNVIGGAPNNFVDPGIVGATIAGGGVLNFGTNQFEPGPGPNHVSAIFGTICGGRRNTVGADHSTIAGGHDNVIESFAYDSIIGSGSYNVINSYAGGGVIGGGYDNSIQFNAYASVIGGGELNTVGVTVVGAPLYGMYGTIGGGYFNTMHGEGASIGGGVYNTVGSNSIASTIGGGYNNVVSNANNSISNAAVAATISGGYSNLCGSSYATVPGGYNNSALGSNSFAAGSQALASGNGSFVWNSFPNPNYAGGDNEFYIFSPNGFSVDYDTQRADGGGTKWVYIGNALGGSGIFKVAATIAAWNGAYLSDGGAWTSTSDRARKENFAPADVRSVLDKLAALPVQTWNYTNDPASTRHLGPVAQDFHNAFGLNGPDDLHIADLDESGVALAAIQGLNQKLEEQLKEKRGEISELRHQMQLLEQRLEQLEKSPAIPPLQSMNSGKN